MKNKKLNGVNPINKTSDVPNISPISNSLFIIPFFIFYSLFLIPITASAEEILPYARVVYRLDGGVSIIHALVSACKDGEQISRCLDREQDKNETLKGLLSDDVSRDQIPTDRSERDKWVGEKGKGISINHSLVTKQEKQQELESLLDTELAKETPSEIEIAILNRMTDKLKDIKTNLIPTDRLSEFIYEPKLGGIKQIFSNEEMNILERIMRWFINIFI